MSKAQDTQQRRTHRGQCHCGAVQFRFSAPETLNVIDCNCSICSMTGFRHVIVPHVDFELRSGGQDLVEYRFNTGQARHLFCGLCGVKSFYQPRSHPDGWSVNLNCIAPSSYTIGEVTNIDGRNWEASIGDIS